MKNNKKIAITAAILSPVFMLANFKIADAGTLFLILSVVSTIVALHRIEKL